MDNAESLSHTKWECKSGENVLSIFEPHTDIIKKGQRKIVYGHKPWFWERWGDRIVQTWPFRR